MSGSDGGILTDFSVWEMALLAFGLLLTIVMAVFLGIVLHRAGRGE